MPRWLQRSEITCSSCLQVSVLKGLHRTVRGCSGEELSTAAVAPLVRIQSVDAVHSNLWSSETTLSGLILNPSRVPPVVAVRRSWWETEGGLNETFGLLALYQLCLRLAVEEKIRYVDELVAVDAAETFERRLLDDSDYLRMLRRVYDRHRVPLEELSSALLLNRLVNASTLAARHRELVGYRDDAAAELDAMGTEIATLRARLADRGRGAVEWGDFRRLSPISREWGFDRGNPIDRYTRVLPRLYLLRRARSRVGGPVGRLYSVDSEDLESCAPTSSISTTRTARRRQSPISDTHPTCPTMCTIASFSRKPSTSSTTCPPC